MICLVCNQEKGEEGFRPHRKVCRECCRKKEREQRLKHNQLEDKPIRVCKTCQRETSDFFFNKGSCRLCVLEAQRLRKGADKSLNQVINQKNNKRRMEVQSTSSGRFKTDIRDYPADLKNFDNIRPVIFKPKEGFGKDMDDRKDYPGFIAEELAEIYPEFVIYEPDDKTILSVAYDKLSVLLVSKIKDQQRQINSLFDKIQNLENRL